LVEEEADGDNGDDDDEPINPLVDALFDEIEYLRMQLFEAEMRSAIVEAEVREEVMQEMETRMREMERLHARRLMAEVEQSDVKTDAKIDLLHKSGLFASPVKRRPPPAPVSDTSEEDDVEMSLMDDSSRSPSVSPLARKANMTPRVVREILPVVPDPPMLPSDTDEAELTESGDETSSVAASGLTTESGDDDDSESEAEWVPPVPPSKSTRPGKPKVPATARRAPKTQAKLARNVSSDDLSDVSIGRSPTKGAQRKKRQLAKTPVVTEEQYNKMIAAQGQSGVRQASTKQ